MQSEAAAGFMSGMFVTFRNILVTYGETCMFLVHIDANAVFSAFVNELTCFVLVDTIPKLSAIYCTA